MRYIVYKHTSPSGHVYIGQTCRIKQRFGNNGANYKGSTAFWQAIQKYGWDNIKHEILFEGLTKEQADQIEIELIAKYKSLGISYNIAPGGADFSAPWTDEQRQKASQSAKLRAQRPGESERRRIIKLAHPNTEEGRKKISIAMSGSKNPMYGKPRPDSVKEKIRNKLLGTHASAETKEKLKNHYRQYGHPMTGKHHSESSKILIGNNTRGRRAVHKDGVYKKVRSDEYESYLNMGWLPGQK